VKSAPFTYHRPETLDEALALLSEHGDDAKVLAGGQSLIPLMALRMGRPRHVVDIARITSLADITEGADGSITLGALVRHVHAEHSPEIEAKAPLIHEAMPLIGHRAIRSQGTVLGSIAHGDPAAEMPAVVLATGATLVATSAKDGRREIAAGDFFQAYLTTALRPDELLTDVTFPSWPSGAVGSVTEVARRHGDYALVGLVASLNLDGNTVASAALAFFGAASTPVRVSGAEQTLLGSALNDDSIETAAAAASAGLDPPGDIHGTTTYRRHLAGVLTRRGLRAAAAKIGVPA
jgi:carbon-monoxide dehydrogenase medium subunit